jgi:protease I
MKKIVMVVAQEGFRDEELLEPKAYFEKEGFQVIIAAPQEGLCKGMLGGVVEASVALADVSLKKVKAVVVVGGVKSPLLAEEPSLGKLLSQAKEENVVIGAICLAPMVVASFDVVRGMHATVFKTDESLATLQRHGVSFLDEEVIVDRWFVTANGPQAAIAFAENVVETIAHH